MSKRIEVAVSEELFAAVERLRGDVSRQRWMLRAVEVAVGILDGVDTVGVARAAEMVRPVAQKLERPVAPRVSPSVPVAPPRIAPRHWSP